MKKFKIQRNDNKRRKFHKEPSTLTVNEKALVITRVFQLLFILNFSIALSDINKK